jgi:hypothetical protein
MGHAFVLAALLTQPNNLPWGAPPPPQLTSLEQLHQERLNAAATEEEGRAKEADQKRVARKAKAQKNEEEPPSLGDFAE